MEDHVSASRDSARIDAAAQARDGVPLVLDVDGTLLRTDLLFETLCAALGRNLLAALWVVVTCWVDPARLKRRLLDIAGPEVELLPVNDAVIDLAVNARAMGRPVHLASAADRRLVDAVARRFGLEGPHFATSDGVNLKGAAKAAALVERLGPAGFDYAGNARADLAIWRAARQVIAVGPGPRLTRRLRALGKPLHLLPAGRRPGTVLREMRPHQWIKNLLLFLPALAAHDLTAATLVPVALAVVAFSLGASSIYIVNDLLDLASDRAHPEKRNRPVASGALPIPTAMAASVALAAAALAIGWSVAPWVAALTLAYMAGSLVYSLWLKKHRWLDVAALAGLFVLRVLTGAAAAQTPVPGWLLAFVFAVFLTLACVKRMTEIKRALRRGYLPGRGYTRADFPALERGAYACAALSAALFVVYALGTPASVLYDAPWLLACAAAPMALWLARVVRLGGLGREDYDPVVFVTHDVTGLAIAACGLAIVVLAV